MYDNKMRLSQDVLEKAEQIASEWGLKNARAAIEAVFRKYADDYLYGRIQSTNPSLSALVAQQVAQQSVTTPVSHTPISQSKECDALDELDDLLGL